MSKTLYIAIFITIVQCTPFLSVSPSMAEDERQQAEIHDIVITNSDSEVLLFGTLKNSFTEEMILGVKSGLPIQFSFYIQLEADSTLENFEGIDKTFTHILTYDTLKETYSVELGELKNRKHSSQSLIEIQQHMNELNGISVIPLSQLQENVVYTLKLRAELHKKTLPMSLSKVTPFLSWWDQETDWYEIKFTL